MKRFLPAPGSLSRRLLAWLFGALVLVLAATSYHAYREALAAANTAYDRSLLAVARVIAERVDLHEGRVVVEVPYVALDFFEADLRGRVFYRVTGLKGEFVSGFDDLPALPDGIARSEDYFALARFYDAQYRGEPVRIVALHQPVLDESQRGMALVQVAETLVSREGITGRLLRGALVREAVLVLLVAVVILVVVRVALRPVEKLREDLASREPTNLAPLAAHGLPSEVRPIVEGMNDYMRRLRVLLDAQERFIADASHQLRTPLTLAKTQAELALREEDPQRMRETVAAMHHSVDDTVRLANELLGRARARHGIANAVFEAVDLAAVTRQACLDLAPGAVQRRIDLGFEGEARAPIEADAVLVRELVCNLVDNAIRHSPECGHVSVRMAADAGHVTLEVEDSGAGIAAADRERVFDPFFRSPSGAPGGAGLGLTIVRDIARAHHATIELGDGRDGRGLRVEVRFPRRQPAERP